ncbi:lamin tail domain-containing protein [Streptomyces sp. NPDC048272]|uniref:lamin tail domain-containing protein n=1 Tax=Streptomyces sp. NPDC048272 TaxID=3154616 RepID=UPI00343514C6
MFPRLPAGAIVSAVGLPDTAADRGLDGHPRVEISRVQADSPGRDDRSNRSLNGEWVEIRNTTRQPVNLRGWTLPDSDGNRYRFIDTRIAGRAIIRTHTGSGRDTVPTSSRASATTSGTTAPTPPPCAATATVPSAPSPGAAAAPCDFSRPPVHGWRPGL